MIKAAPTLKPRKCAHCREPFTPARPLQKCCQPQCAMDYLDAKKARAEAKRAKEDRAADRVKREQMKTVPQLKHEAQEAVNRYVRLRDAGKGCFICGATLVLGGVGGGFDAGHIRSRSNSDNLRFDERNVHGQCKRCNAPGATKDHVMKAAAIRLLGAEGAEALYADNKPIKWTREGLREIRAAYRRKARELERRWKQS